MFLAFPIARCGFSMEVYNVTEESLNINLISHSNIGLCVIVGLYLTCGFRDMFCVDLLFVCLANSPVYF